MIILAVNYEIARLEVPHGAVGMGQNKATLKVKLFLRGTRNNNTIGCKK